MNIINDCELNIAIGLRASSKVWKNTKIAWSGLVERMAKPVVTNETYKQYINASKEEQLKIKDVGGFVGGYLTHNKRDKNNVLYRQVVTLDIDFSSNNLWSDFTMLYDCAGLIHSTHKSCKDEPRHRLVIPLDRTVSQEEYQAISRRIAGDLNIELFDQSTFEVNRLMFWPSIAVDAEYYFEYQDGPILVADSILDRYNDWHDVTQWPTAERQVNKIISAVSKQEDPEAKKGIVGVFCRTYTIEDAIDKFLQDEYVSCGDGRYTYTKGSTAAGMLVYENKFAYSHHGTDPAGGRLCNAFDLVRLHKFGHLDTGKEKNEVDKRSFKAMEEFAANDATTKKRIAKEKLEEAKFDFVGLEPEEVDKVSEETAKDDSWLEELEANTRGEYNSTANNINLIIQSDPLIKDTFKLNLFNNKRYIMRSLPWRKIDESEPFKDVDYSGMRNYIECIYGINASQKIDDALALEFERNTFHPIREYLNNLEWDGKQRVDNLLIDYFGADDNAYSRRTIRKTLCAAVARVFNPGIKFDLVLVLVGPQETYKSTFIQKLGKNWFSDTFTTVQGKEAFEQLQGAWIIEIAELSGFKKAEIEAVKHFITKREDSFRPAYGRVVETYKRQCVFLGTTNNKDFLKDPTGNRRFMPIDVNPELVTKSVADDLTDEEIDQIWAEALLIYKSGEPLYLTGEASDTARDIQMKHTDIDDRAGVIINFLNTKLPKSWPTKTIYMRRAWLEDPLGEEGTEQRDMICTYELWCECFGKERGNITRKDAYALNDIMKTLKDWEYVSSTRSFPIYGPQRYYKRVK